MTTPKRYEEMARAVVLKLNGWQPSPFDPVDQEFAVRDVYAALRAAAIDAVKELSRTSQIFDEDAANALIRRLDSGEDL